MSQSQEIKSIRIQKSPCASCMNERSELCRRSAECEAYHKWAKEYRELREKRQK